MEHIPRLAFATILTIASLAGRAGAAPLVAMPPSSGPPDGSAAPAPAPPVEELVKLALASAPSVAAVRERLAAAREMIVPAGALPDPMVEVMLQDVGFPSWTVGSQEMSMFGPEVRQDIFYPGKRAARRAAAEADAAVPAAELDELRRELAMNVRTLYARVYALDQEKQYLGAAREMLDMLAATAAARYSAGQAEQEAVLKAQLEASRVAERLDDLAAERTASVAALNRILDLPGARPLGTVAALPTPAVPPLPWDDLVLKGSPAVAVKRAAETAAEKRLAATRLDLKPDFTTGAAVGLRGGFDPVVTLRFGLVFPLWKKEKQEPLISAAGHELAMARAETKDAEAAARAQAARLAAEWQRASRQVVRYRQALVPQSSAAIDAARSSYLAGRGDFLTVVDDFNRWLDARVGLARREADRFATWAEIEALIDSPTGEPSGEEK